MKSIRTKLFTLLFAVLLCQMTAFAATGDITAVTILGDSTHNGFAASIVITGLSTGGTYAYGLGANNAPSGAKIVFTVTSPGFDSSGAATTVSRTVYGTTCMRQTYQTSLGSNATNGLSTPCNPPSPQESGSSPVTVEVALSEFIYATDTVASVTIGSGFYTQAATPNNACAACVSVTNSSTLVYPKPIGGRATIPNQLVGNSFLVEWTAFANPHGYPVAGQTIAAVKTTCTDTHSHTSPTVTTTAAIASTLPSVVDTLVIPVNGGGSGYAVADTGTVTMPAGVNGPTAYRVVSVSGGVVTSISVTTASANVSGDQTALATATGGAQPGSGTGLVVNVKTAKVLVYPATMDFSTLTSKDIVTCNMQAYPKVGDKFLDSTAGQDGVAAPSGSFGPLLEVLDSAGTYGQTYCVVDPTNGTNSAVTTFVYLSQALAEAAYASANTNSYASVGRCATEVKAYNNANFTNSAGAARNEAGGGHALLEASTGDWLGITFPTGTMQTWFTGIPMTGKDKTSITLTSNGTTGSAMVANSKLRFTDVFFNTTLAATFYNNSATGDQLWLDNIKLNATGAATFDSPNFVYLTNGNTTQCSTGYNGSNTSVPTQFPLIRGNTGTTTDMTAQLYEIVGNRNVLLNFIRTGNPSSIPVSDLTTFAFNGVYKTTTSQSLAITGFTTNISKGIAIVQNVTEQESTANGCFFPWSDGNTSTSNNILIWYFTCTGQRINGGYNDGGDGTGGAAGWDKSFLNVNWSMIGNIFDNFNNKDDTFSSQLDGGSRAITNITQANPAVVTSAANSYLTGNRVYIFGVVGMTQVNGASYTVTVVDGTHFSIGVDSTGFTAYSSGGTVSSGNPARVGSWPVGFHVGMNAMYVHAASSTDFGGEFAGLNSPYATGNYGFVYDASSTTHGNGLGNGNYNLVNGTATAVGLISPANMNVLPVDITGNARNGSAGAYEGNPLATGGAGATGLLPLVGAGSN